jgi:hypothetical protein
MLLKYAAVVEKRLLQIMPSAPDAEQSSNFLGFYFLSEK